MNRPIPPAATALALSLAALLVPTETGAQPAFGSGFAGEVGLGVYGRSEIVRGAGGSTVVLPYVYGDWGRAFARTDTFGVKTLPLGSGHLELVGRVSTEGWKADQPGLGGLGDRSNPVPLGIGTSQRTPFGMVFLYAMHDLTSGGNYLEGLWAARVPLGPVALYPLAGIEYRSGAYVRHLYGVDAAQSAASGQAQYSPGGATVPMLGLAATVPVAGPWAVQLQWRHRWLGSAIADSPIVGSRTQDSGHVALTYAFK